MDIVELYIAGKSLPQIEAETGIRRSTARNRLIAAGVTLRSRKQALLIREGLGAHLKGKRRTFSESHKAAIGASARKRGEQTAAGVSLKSSGYVEITRGPNKGRSVHVTTFEERLGRRLLPDEIVHHIDGDRANNHPDNLALMTRAAHARLHRREQRLAKGK